MSENERTTIGWVARDPSGVLSPYTYTLRNTGPDDVYIKVHYCGVCHSDLHQIKNDLGMSNYPMVPRHRVIGEVLEVGSDVTKFHVGEIVGAGLPVGCCKNYRACDSDIEQYCKKKIWSYNDVYTDGKPTQGGFAETMVVGQNFVVKIPEGLAPEQAAPLLWAEKEGIKRWNIGAWRSWTNGGDYSKGFWPPCDYDKALLIRKRKRLLKILELMLMLLEHEQNNFI